MQDNNLGQKIIGLLNTSSETFMLIALVSLFVLPVVIAKNLEPVVKSNLSQNINEVQNVAAVPSAESNVLGASTAINPIAQKASLKTIIVEDTLNQVFFENHSSTITDKEYSLSLSTNKRFGKIPLFRLTNDSASTTSFNLFAKVDGDLKVKSNQEKSIYVGNLEYKINETTAFPVQVLVSPGQEVIVSLMSSKTSPTNLTVSLNQN